MLNDFDDRRRLSPPARMLVGATVAWVALAILIQVLGVLLA